ncbi:hypothetical protein K490DRAFT_67699 [Saccharata proteae CBS 121410]|uniref:Uncharacterized protein n=1 Tax=Saccharata proteae CBS 121410 TaxID=1314787 RepID=A0A9P4LTH1_9PEZI|nr:hypothetical protein K490DRAFT_67699 [Saccharata proteae CBS 121410]
MSDYQGDDYDCDDDYDGDGWLYVEEPDDLAEDLAERAVPSPAPQEIADPDALYDSDFYEYFCDIEYNSDGFNDVGKGDSKPMPDGQSARKGKGKGAQQNSSQKARKRTDDRYGVQSSTPAVAWRSQKSRANCMTVEMFKGEDEKPYALFKDHEERFRDVPGFSFQDAPEETDEAADDMIAIDKKEAERRLAYVMQNLTSNAAPLEEVDAVKVLETAVEFVENCGIDEEELLMMLEKAIVTEGQHSSDYHARMGREVVQKAMAETGYHGGEDQNPDGLEQGFVKEIEGAIARADALCGEDEDEDGEEDDEDDGLDQGFIDELERAIVHAGALCCEDEDGDGDGDDEHDPEEKIVAEVQLSPRINDRNSTRRPAAPGMEGISRMLLSPSPNRAGSPTPPNIDTKGKGKQKQPQATASAGPSSSTQPQSSKVKGKRKAFYYDADEVLGKWKRMRPTMPSEEVQGSSSKPRPSSSSSLTPAWMKATILQQAEAQEAAFSAERNEAELAAEKPNNDPKKKEKHVKKPNARALRRQKIEAREARERELAEKYANGGL